jgi:hypothetical protein
MCPFKQINVSILTDIWQEQVHMPMCGLAHMIPPPKKNNIKCIIVSVPTSTEKWLAFIFLSLVMHVCHRLQW